MKLTMALLLILATPAAAEIRTGSFASRSLGRDVAYLVDLPPSYASSGERRYPVVYALHGLFERPAFWEGRGLAAILQSLRERKEVPEFLVVVVDGGNSFFVNGPLGRYEDLITRDLVSHMESSYRVVHKREGRGLLGVSMGGYAALRLALKEPGAFGGVAAHSAMLLLKIPTRDDGAGRWHMEAFQRVFGNPIDQDLWSASDPLVWAEKADPGKTPALSVDCGADDRYGLAAGNTEMHRRLERRKVRHEFALHPGDHGYEYVRSVLPGSLRFLGTYFKAER